jgi:hypothetical protein
MPELFWILGVFAVDPTAARRTRRFMLFCAKLVFWPLALLTLVALALHLGAWQTEFKIAGPFAAETNPARHSLILAVPQEGPAEWWRQPLLGDDGGKASRSFLELWIDGSKLGPPHSRHETIREGRTTGFSHWGPSLIFSLPPNVENVPETIATLRYNIRPRAWVTFALTVSSALLGWLLCRRAIRTFLPSHQDATNFVEPGHRPRTAQIVGGLLFAIFFALALRLRQRDLEFLIEPDFAWETIETWRQFFASFNPDILPKPTPYVYLDGQFIVYALVDGSLRWFAETKFLRSIFPNDSSFALGAALIVNGAAYAAASAIFFAAVFRLTGSIVIAVAMAFGFFLAPQMISIHLARVDYLNSLPISVIFYCSCILAMGEDRKRHAIALGAAMAFAATLKINGLFLGAIPACAALAAFNPRKIGPLATFALIGLVTFALVYFALMGRFFYYLTPAEIVQHYLDTIELVRPWGAFTAQASPFYYNIELMMGHGAAFVALYLTCAAATLAYAVLFRSRTSIFLCLCFVVLSASSMAASLKYERGGYHLLPIFFAIVGFSAAEAARSSLNRLSKVVALAIAAAIFATSIVKSAAVYADVVAKRRGEAVAILAIKREPREWLLSHFPPGTRICVQTDSTWSLPDLEGFVPVDGPLALPYLDPKALSHAAPPNLDEARHYCRVVVTSDYHRTTYGDLLLRASPENAAKWSRFFDTLNEKFPPVVFSSPIAIYSKEIYINDWGAQ